MSKYVFNGKITGEEHHFGDNYFGSYQEFIKESKQNFSSAEKELIELIFDNFKSEEEKKDLLVSLKNLSDDPKENHSEVPIWKKFIIRLNDAGLREVANKVIDFLRDRIPDFNTFLF
ncbi:hypothetical protein GYM62_01965 [Algoriphagus sp. NBT04N3]|jgi:hypothetical protein|uniref:hypothetical protein n=1 Tax=Algoriphagus sp. NBT04N3 TaxID=2705473 RepID=UPI001C6324B6|nr:hypothetical protein [Algoriphagus sp. NBT04N3]QYH37627.1 hypothetical protein GYM62_01965 [Algoriphagus sp. NBT04N3]